MSGRRPVTAPDVLLADRLSIYASHSVEIPCQVDGLHPTCWVIKSAADFLGWSYHRQIQIPGHRNVMAHWVSWLVHFGPVPDDDLTLELDHLCQTPACWNPWHLDLVTTAENKRRIGDRKTYLELQERISRIGREVLA